jgi:hypothetical protein
MLLQQRGLEPGGILKRNCPDVVDRRALRLLSEDVWEEGGLSRDGETDGKVASSSIGEHESEREREEGKTAQRKILGPKRNKIVAQAESQIA